MLLSLRVAFRGQGRRADNAEVHLSTECSHRAAVGGFLGELRGVLRALVAYASCCGASCPWREQATGSTSDSDPPHAAVQPVLDETTQP